MHRDYVNYSENYHTKLSCRSQSANYHKLRQENRKEIDFTWLIGACILTLSHVTIHSFYKTSPMLYESLLLFSFQCLFYTGMGFDFYMLWKHIFWLCANSSRHALRLCCALTVHSSYVVIFYLNPLFYLFILYDGVGLTQMAYRVQIIRSVVVSSNYLFR